MKKTSCRDSMLNPIARMKSLGKRHNNTFIWSIDWCLITKLVYTVNDEWKQHQFKDSAAPWKIKECSSRDRCNMCMFHCYKLNCRTSGNPVCCHHATCIYLYHQFKLHGPRHPPPLGISRLAGYSSKFKKKTHRRFQWGHCFLHRPWMTFYSILRTMAPITVNVYEHTYQRHCHLFI